MTQRRGETLSAASDCFCADLALPGAAKCCVESRMVRGCRLQATALVSIVMLAMTKLFGWVAG